MGEIYERAREPAEPTELTEPTEQPNPSKLKVSTRTDTPLRCPYCHDALMEEEPSSRGFMSFVWQCPHHKRTAHAECMLGMGSDCHLCQQAIVERLASLREPPKRIKTRKTTNMGPIGPMGPMGPIGLTLEDLESLSAVSRESSQLVRDQIKRRILDVKGIRSEDEDLADQPQQTQQARRHSILHLPQLAVGALCLLISVMLGCWLLPAMSLLQLVQLAGLAVVAFIIVYDPEDS